jgi:hypothetical protein
MPGVRKRFVAVVLQSALSHGVLERVAKRIPTEVSEENASPKSGGGPRGLSLTKKHGQKHANEQIQEAMDMIRRGENPFRVSKKLGIARTTLLYHLEKVPDNEFQVGVNPILINIFRQIEIYYWKTKLRLIKNMFHKSAKSDEKLSTQMWSALEDVPRPPVGSSQAAKAVMENATIDDKVTFREFIVERKGKSDTGMDVPKENLGEGRADSSATVREATTVVDEKQGKAG